MSHTCKNLRFSSSNNFGLNKVKLFRDNIHSLLNMFVSHRKLMLPGKMYLIESLRSDLWGTSKSMIQHSIKRNSSHKPIISTYRHINASKGMVIQWLFKRYINCQCWVHLMHVSIYWLICKNWFASQYCRFLIQHKELKSAQKLQETPLAFIFSCILHVMVYKIMLWFGACNFVVLQFDTKQGQEINFLHKRKNLQYC